MPNSTPPVHVEILDIEDRFQVYAGHALTLRASASAGAENLDGLIHWRSSRDGFLGQGGEITVRLTEGQHTIRAAIRLPGRPFSGSVAPRSRTDSDDTDSTDTESDESGKNETDETDKDDAAQDVVTIDAVPVNYPDVDT